MRQRQRLADHGIPVPREFFASSEEQAVAAAKALSFPVALKVDSPDIAHKTEVGGVRLGLTAPEEVAEAFRNIMTDVQLGAPAARINGVSVQEMVSGGIEVIAGLSRQPPFGLSLTVGAGGVFVELMQDAVLSLLPLDRAACHALLSKTRVATLLRGYRGGGVADIEALVDLLTKFAAIGRSYSEEIEAFELNPISVLADGKGVRALDALLIPRAGKSPIGGGAASTTAPDGARL